MEDAEKTSATITGNDARSGASALGAAPPFTPAPWRWNLNRNARQITLESEGDAANMETTPLAEVGEFEE